MCNRLSVEVYCIRQSTDDRTFHGLDIGCVEPNPDLVADELTAGSALLFGQADEQIPVTVVRGVEYEDGVPNSDGVVRRGLRKSVQLTARLKAREWF
ncbi:MULTISPECIES: F420-dependent oxidoreductase [Haloarcula]|uniref:Putative F420-dependent oxidoreductase n=1 Tax=Haloarcula amylolytica JCM 13557 TaxID=1227452 RepID=M0KSX6_9EURY|nr:F420-dependent oxidoreductase [Haloarcula amylolytica]EMA23314.1 putative F420-dependent oxidoreductase [Haloarcula amylolytica JCM 13557]